MQLFYEPPATLYTLQPPTTQRKKIKGLSASNFLIAGSASLRKLAH
jgi:hypothetical protein